MNAVAFTAPHKVAASIGYAMLEQGASAIDAMIAAAAAITVVYPHMNSLGGDGFWLIHRKGRPPIAIDACGTAAMLANLDFYRHESAIPSRGGKAALTMAGTLDGWRCAREFAASMDTTPFTLAELLEPAIRLAEQGITVTNSLQTASEKVAESMQNLNGYQSVFCPSGRTLRAGETFCNPGLGRFMRKLSVNGLSDFYRGELAMEMAQWLELAGSPLRLADFATYQAKVVEPLQLAIKGATLYNLPPPTQGLASLLILALYDRVHQHHKPTSEAADIHLLVECCKQAFLVRDRVVTDPSRLAPDWLETFSAEKLDQMAAAITSAASPWPRTANPGDTVWMGALDSKGCMVSFIQSVYWEFGSGLVHPDYGVHWNNRGLSFSLDPANLNALKPGCKPFHTLNPAFAIFDDGRRLSYGTMGGEGQPQTQAAVFSRYHYRQQSLQSAISRGRWLLGRTWGDSSHDLKLEADLANDIGADLHARGHQFRTVPAHSEMMGHAGAIALYPDGTAEAATDPRSDGAAFARSTQRE
ncbi:MAG: gamma-glutamyltransferase [Pseudomonadota bacterium]